MVYAGLCLVFLTLVSGMFIFTANMKQMQDTTWFILAGFLCLGVSLIFFGVW